jgi:hypothetical protein
MKLFGALAPEERNGRFHAELEKFEACIRAEGLIEKEQFLGAYYEKFDDGSEQGLVLS